MIVTHSLMDAYDGFSADIRDRATVVFEDYFRTDAENEYFHGNL